jgi:hypothetical protein
MEGPMFLKLGQIFTIQSATYKEFESVTLANMKNYIPHISFLLPKIPILPSSNSENICIPKFLFKGKNEIYRRRKIVTTKPFCKYRPKNNPSYGDSL